MKNVLSIQKVSSLFIVAAFILIFSVNQAGAAFEGAKPVVTEDDFGGWVTALPDGRLMTWWTEDKKGSKTEEGSIQLAVASYSRDNGKSWTQKRTLFEFPPSKGISHYTRDARGCVIIDKEGSLHIFGMYYTQWSWAKFAGINEVFHTKSTDNGKTWSDVKMLPFKYKYSQTHMPFALKSGRIIVPIIHTFEDKNDWGVINAISDDYGITWRLTGQMGETLKDEGTAVELSDGRIWMMFRRYHGDYLIETFSSDNGETWHDIGKSRFIAPASPPAMHRLKDGRIILIWNNSQKPKHVLDRLILAAAITEDEGKTWRGYREIARTNGAYGSQGWVCYPFITQANDGSVFVTYGTKDFKANLLELDPEWLMETEFTEDFSKGLDNWITMKTEGPVLIDHPSKKNKKALSITKPNEEEESGASLNFPFGAKGELTMRLRLEPGFKGARICLTDHFTWPYYLEDGRFGLDIWADGKIIENVGLGEISETGLTLKPGKWHTLKFVWNIKKETCKLTVDDKNSFDLTLKSEAAGICYLRLRSTEEKVDTAGMLVDLINVTVD